MFDDGFLVGFFIILCSILCVNLTRTNFALNYVSYPLYY